MSSIVTRCSVLERLPVAPADRGTGGIVTDDAVRGWIDRVLTAYLDQCARVQQLRTEEGLALRHEVELAGTGASLGDATDVAVSASATEVLPTAFAIGVRIRGAGGDDDGLLLATVTVRLEDPATGVAREIGPDVRDELIALEHAARHFN
jgi:hypothetical protein